MSFKKNILRNMTYPGRLIILGKDITDQYVVVVYAITGRSPSSQARKIEYSSGQALVKPTDSQELKKGNIELLIYPAVKIKEGIAVSNGKHTHDIFKNIKNSSHPVRVLAPALELWDYEPDAPNFTPRISGCVLSGEKAALSVIKRDENGRSLRNYYEFTLTPGKGKLISTYTGKNRDPLPSFDGEPLDIKIHTQNADKTAQYFYNSLEPKKNHADLRVALVCVFSQPPKFHKSDVSIINRQERRG
ncbi:MAG: IMP cyclohydrolase [Candidatus Aminicenantes bacterium]